MVAAAASTVAVQEERANEFRIKSYYGEHTLWGSYFCDTGSRAQRDRPPDIAMMLPSRGVRPPVRP